ncbi:helix-turn-helix transcriptional regulator [Desulfovibrio cuneatus]|uniref:helix-turn-helix transcriptional regulator n=1 Tax=Desulfovibrio cuneatus TaxID=159728 RepID=UPI00041B1710|nr:helix-turn-helix domain-containing protein [Desulfovibrio cuneatus]
MFALEKAFTISFNGSMNIETAIIEAIQGALGNLLATVGGADVAAHLQKAARLEALRKQPLLTPDDVSELYHIPVSTLSTWRSRAKGPNYTKLEGSIFYTSAQIEKWIAANEVKIRR